MEISVIILHIIRYNVMFSERAQSNLTDYASYSTPGSSTQHQQQSTFVHNARPTNQTTSHMSNTSYYGHDQASPVNDDQFIPNFMTQDDHHSAQLSNIIDTTTQLKLHADGTPTSSMNGIYNPCSIQQPADIKPHISPLVCEEFE